MTKIKLDVRKIASYSAILTIIFLSWYGAFYLGVNFGNYIWGS